MKAHFLALWKNSWVNGKSLTTGRRAALLFSVHQVLHLPEESGVQKTEVNWPGPVLDAAVLGADGKTVGAHFAEVKRLSGCAEQDFGVEDGGGAVKCVKAQIENTRASLTFERAIKLPARQGQVTADYCR